jgi:hypothetical protein
MFLSMGGGGVMPPSSATCGASDSSSSYTGPLEESVGSSLSEDMRGKGVCFPERPVWWISQEGTSSKGKGIYQRARVR